MSSIIERQSNYKGYNYIIVFRDLGFRCGYVEIPFNHKYYKKREDYLNKTIYCHGGVTFADSSVPFCPQTEDRWWAGFDCMHGGDGYDFEMSKKYFPDDISVQTYIEDMNSLPICNRGAIHTLEYCEKECKNIIDQLIEIDKNYNATNNKLELIDKITLVVGMLMVGLSVINVILQSKTDRKLVWGVIAMAWIICLRSIIKRLNRRN
jgi:hypothetical protein